MKILIVSDTHGQEKNLEEVLKKEEPIDALSIWEIWRAERILSAPM